MTEWDDYWIEKSKPHTKIYDAIAVQYRKYIIKPYLKKYIYSNFKEGSTLLHAGCGSGQVEDEIINKFTIIGMDISPYALELYRLNHTHATNLILGDILTTGLKNESLDGIYNLGVMEHFYEREFKSILLEFNRILKPDGTIILFIPPEYGSTVIFFKGVHFILNNILKKDIHFQPAEVSRVQSREWMENMITGTGLYIDNFIFETSDLYTHVAIILKKS